VVVSFEVGKGSIEHFPARHDDDVEVGRHFVTPEELSGQPLRSIPLNGRADLACRRHAEPSRRAAIGYCEDRHEPAVCSSPGIVDALEFGPATNTLGGWQLLAAHARSLKILYDYPSSATVSRTRPFARRRFRTIRPFFVAILTLKPWVFFRRRVLGW
jgi:hypothetical protein